MDYETRDTQRSGSGYDVEGHESWLSPMGLFVAWSNLVMVYDVEGDGSWVYPMGVFVGWFLVEMDVTELESEKKPSSSARRSEPGPSGPEGRTAKTRMNTMWETEDEPRMRSASMASRDSTTQVPTVAFDDEDYDGDDEEDDLGTKKIRYIERNGQETTRTTTTAQCDACGDVQLCFKGYATMINGKKDWVISLCEGCGGRSSHDESDTEPEDDERSSDCGRGCRSPYDRSRSPSP
jgi:hypothetical protein